MSKDTPVLFLSPDSSTQLKKQEILLSDLLSNFSGFYPLFNIIKQAQGVGSTPSIGTSEYDFHLKMTAEPGPGA
jgi:hypothetical protein